jgi:prevent-host-death family protein
MERVKIGELRRHLSQWLCAVEHGTEIEITDRNRPIAWLVPVPTGSPRIRLRPPRRRFADVRDKPCRPARWPLDAVALLLEDRRKR